MFRKYFLIVNPYLGGICASAAFLDLIKLVPRKDFGNPTIMGFVVLKSCTTGVIGSIVPVTCFFVGQKLYEKYI